MSKGFTLVETMISAVAVAIVVIAVSASIGGCEADWQQAENSAREFSKKVSGSTGQVSCMKMDTDQDGYCRCTIFRLKKDPLHVECGCQKFCLFCVEGCAGIKAPR